MVAGVSRAGRGVLCRFCGERVRGVGYCGSGILVVKLVCSATAKNPSRTQHLRRKRLHTATKQAVSHTHTLTHSHTPVHACTHRYTEILTEQISHHHIMVSFKQQQSRGPEHICVDVWICRDVCVQLCMQVLFYLSVDTFVCKYV